MAPHAEPQPIISPKPEDLPIRKGIRAVLFGPPGSGKGTQVNTTQFK